MAMLNTSQSDVDKIVYSAERKASTRRENAAGVGFPQPVREQSPSGEENPPGRSRPSNLHSTEDHDTTYRKSRSEDSY